MDYGKKRSGGVRRRFVATDQNRKCRLMRRHRAGPRRRIGPGQDPAGIALGLTGGKPAMDILHLYMQGEAAAGGSGEDH